MRFISPPDCAGEPAGDCVDHGADCGASFSLSKMEKYDQFIVFRDQSMKASISTGMLQAFIALDELKHFTRAAERCHTSQSAFSVMIRKLEAAVGARLFERSTRKVTLTPEGELFAQVARNLIQEIDAAFDDMAE